MESWKNLELTKEEEDEGFEADEIAICEEESFDKSLVGKLWTTDPFNVRIFKQVIIGAWRLKNPVEVQELNKNLFLFRFATKKDLETVLKNGPWSFDRNLVILRRISGDEQPSKLELHTGEFWARIYDLPLKLRSDAMAKRLGDIIGSFEEVDSKVEHRMGKFLRLKTTIDLKKPLKRGTVIKYQGSSLQVFFKYERLPTFCYVCGRIGHQIKDCEELEEEGAPDYEELEVKELPFGQWLRASPLPKFTRELKKDSSDGSCSRSLFSEASNSKSMVKDNKEKGVAGEQPKEKGTATSLSSPEVSKVVEKPQTEIESVAEPLGNVAISKADQIHLDKGSQAKPEPVQKLTKKWTRKKGVRKPKSNETLVVELGKRTLVDVSITEGDPMVLSGGEQKRRLIGEVTASKLPKGVLDGQHLLKQ